MIKIKKKLMAVVVAWDHLYQLLFKKKSEKDTVKSFVHQKQMSKTSDVVPWPSRGDTPINEFVTEGYISCAFPTLLATGDADFLAPRE